MTATAKRTKKVRTRKTTGKTRLVSSKDIIAANKACKKREKLYQTAQALATSHKKTWADAQGLLHSLIEDLESGQGRLDF